MKKTQIFILVIIVLLAFSAGFLFSKNVSIFAKGNDDGSIPEEQLEEWYEEVEKAKEQDAEYQAIRDKAQEEKGKDVINDELSQEDIIALEELRKKASQYPAATFERAEEEIKGSIPKELPRLNVAEVHDIVNKSNNADDIISAINDIHKYPDFIYGTFGNVVYVLSEATEDGYYAVWYGFDTKTESRCIKLIITRENGSETVREIELLYSR